MRVDGGKNFLIVETGKVANDVSLERFDGRGSFMQQSVLNYKGKKGPVSNANSW